MIGWDPGDGNDTVTGGAGVDRLAFNGSNANETIDLSAAAGHVRLARNIGTVTLDLDDVETADLRALGGADTITVTDLTGTDLTTLTTDLAAFDGTDDLLNDEVIVNGTAGDDVIAVVDEGADVVAEGLAATIRIAHADPTLDRLTVNGLGGNDEITATPGAGALILLNLQP